MTTAEHTRVLALDLRAVRPFEGQPRTDFDQDRLADLAASIKEFGQQVAIIVHELPKPAGAVRFEVIDGERRLRACKLAGLKTVRAEVRGAKDADHQFMQSVVSNFGREEHSHIETMRAVARVSAMAEYASLPSTKKLERVGALFARSGQWVHNYLRLDTIAEPVKAHIAGRKINAQVALLIAAIADHDEQVRLADIIVKKDLGAAQARLLIRASMERRADSRDRVRQKGSEPHRVSAQVFNHVTRIGQAAEIVLDMPRKTMVEAIAQRPEVARSLRKRLDAAIDALTQVRQALGDS